MTRTLVVTFIADDRPGLVQRMAQTVADNGGNWLDSRMAQLAGKFAGVVLLEVAADDGRNGGLETALAGLRREGFHLTVEASEEIARASGQVFDLEILGPDQPGIVREISHCLVERGIGVEEMETDIREAPHAGGTLFHAHARVLAPDGVGDAELRDALEVLAGTLMVDISLGKVL